MTIYVSEPVEIEAIQWLPTPEGVSSEFLAISIVAWVNANGGEAEYRPDDAQRVGTPRIWVRTKNGSYPASPGDYIVKGETRFQVRREVAPASQMSAMVTVREFYPVANLSEVRVDHKWRVK